MSRFDNIFSQVGTPILLEQNGRTVVYLDEDQADLSLTAIVGPDESEIEQEEERGRVRKRTRMVTIATDPTAATGGVTDPREGKKLRIDGEVWTIEAVESRTNTSARLRCTRPTIVEPSRPNYRGP